MKALGGGKLYGDRILHVAFLDETGLSDSKNEPYLVVGGVIVDMDRLYIQVKNHMDSLVSRLIPEVDENTFVFHATEIIHGGSQLDRTWWSFERGLNLAQELVATIHKFSVPVVYAAFEREVLVRGDLNEYAGNDKTKKRKARSVAHLNVAIHCALEVESWMRKHTPPNECCMLHIEDHEDHRSMLSHIREVEKFVADDKEVDKPLFERIVENPNFIPKKSSRLIQLADFCLYVVGRSLAEDRKVESLWPIMKSFTFGTTFLYQK